MNDVLVGLLLLVGSVFALLSAVGIVRLPDLYMRMQASTKAATLGVSCIVLAVALFFGELGVITRGVLVIVFVFLTAPVAAHVIGRAAYYTGTPLWEHSIVDERAAAPLPGLDAPAENPDGRRA